MIHKYPNLRLKQIDLVSLLNQIQSKLSFQIEIFDELNIFRGGYGAQFTNQQQNQQYGGLQDDYFYDNKGIYCFCNGISYKEKFKYGVSNSKQLQFQLKSERYEECLKNNKRDGFEVSIILMDLDMNGNRYEIDKYDGKGVLYFSDGDRYEGIYEGDFKEGKFHGQGIYYYSSGDRYDGELKDGKFDGKGIIYYSRGGGYEGNFKNGKRDGKGVYQYSSGNRYEGDFKDGKYDKGIMDFYYSDGTKYEGDFKNGKYDDKGIYCYSNGDRYEGDFKYGKFDDKGIIYKTSRNRYEGNFINDKRDGQGVYYYSNGDRLEGHFQNSEYEKAVIYYQN
ncbi:hypothetical protein ABPG72_020259 [Tetrahymena utriculariae]